MSSKQIWGIVLIVIGLLFFAAGFTLGYAYPQDYIYSGKVLMTQQEYNQFKEDCASPDVTISSVAVLDTDYPTLVTFSVLVPSNNFPFGTNVGAKPSDWLVLILGFVPFAPIGGLLLGGWI